MERDVHTKNNQTRSRVEAHITKDLEHGVDFSSQNLGHIGGLPTSSNTIQALIAVSQHMGVIR